MEKESGNPITVRFVWFENEHNIYAYHKGWALQFDKESHKYKGLSGHFDVGEFSKVHKPRRIVKPKDYKVMIDSVPMEVYNAFFVKKPFI